MATQITVPIGERTKSVKFGAAYSPSQTFNPDKDLFFQGSMVLAGMAVAVDVPSSGKVTVDPGTFIQNGIIVDITASQEVDAPGTPTFPLYLVATTSDEVFNSPVDIQFTTTPAADSVIIAEWPTGGMANFRQPLRASISNLRDVLKAIDSLRPVPGVTPDEKVRVLPGRYTKSDGTGVIDIATFATSTGFTPVSGGTVERYDVLSFDDSGTLVITEGSEVISPGEPFLAAPEFPNNQLAIAIVKIDETGTVVIDESDIFDVREFLRRPKLNVELAPSTITSTPKDNYDVTEGGALLASNEVQLVSTVLVDITGLKVTPTAAQTAGAKMTILNGGAVDITLKHDNTGSDAENRMLLLGAANLTLEPGDWVELTYFGVDTRWRQTS